MLAPKFSPLHIQRDVIHNTLSDELLRARTHCNMLVISSTDMAKVLQHFPESIVLECMRFQETVIVVVIVTVVV